MLLRRDVIGRDKIVRQRIVLAFHVGTRLRVDQLAVRQQFK
jgi:hypothetical protein